MKNGKPRNMEKQEKWRKENQEMGKKTRKEKKIRFFKYYFPKILFSKKKDWNRGEWEGRWGREGERDGKGDGIVAG